MEEEGLEPDTTTHTLLLMAHEKRGDWEAALDVYALMSRLEVPRNSFTYRWGGWGRGWVIWWGPRGIGRWVGWAGVFLVGGRVGLVGRWMG